MGAEQFLGPKNLWSILPELSQSVSLSVCINVSNTSVDDFILATRSGLSDCPDASKSKIVNRNEIKFQSIKFWSLVVSTVKNMSHH
jgi:hypothetical protein